MVSISDKWDALFQKSADSSTNIVLPRSTNITSVNAPRRRALPNDLGEELKNLQRKLSHVALDHSNNALPERDIDEYAIENLLPYKGRELHAALNSGVDAYHMNAVKEIRRYLCLENVVENTENLLSLNILD
ncbi:hypothetical protein HK096_010966, partial [Nowakowskiella sp. JEL0078]